MGKIQSIIMIILMLSVANTWGAGFLDDFNRPNGDLENDWATQADGTIEVTIVDNEVLIAGEQATDWARSGLSRDVGGETRISFDFRRMTASMFISASTTWKPPPSSISMPGQAVPSATQLPKTVVGLAGLQSMVPT